MINLNFKNLPHALATFWKATIADSKKVEAGIEKVESHKAEIEGVSGVVAAAAAPGSALAVMSAEDAAFAVLGAIDAALKAGDAATEQKLLDAGLDITAINAVKAVGTQSVGAYTLVKSVTK